MLLFSAQLNFIPPPKSNRYLTSKTGKRFLPKRITQAIDEAILILSSFKKETINIPCQLYVCYTFPNRRKRDLDNLNKTLQDCLEKAGIIKDDALFYRIISEKKFIPKKEEVLIQIFDLNEPISLYPFHFSD